MKKNISLFALGIFFICSIVSCHGKKAPPRPPVSVTAFKVEPQTIPADFEFIGVAKSSHPVEIRSRVEGYLISINYTEGSMVEENALLFEIDPRSFEASVEEAKGELARQEAILWRAKKSLERLEPLYEKNAVSRRDLDNAIAQDLAAQASVIMAKSNLVKAELNLSYTKITSPICGLSGKANYREGTLITPSINGLLTYVSVIDPIWVYFNISDNDVLLGRTEHAQKTLILPSQEEYVVSLELADGSLFPCPGKINFAAPILDEQTGTLSVRADFPNPEGQILPGQFVRAKVMGAVRPNAIFVPQKSLFQGKRGMYVFVIDADNKVTSRSVEVGEWYENYWIIKKGLEKGEVVVADGVNKIMDGSTVNVTSFVNPFQPQDSSE